MPVVQRKVNDLQSRIKALGWIFARVESVPEEWASLAGKSSSVSASCITDCSSYAVLANAWRKALKWTSGLDHALTAMLASIVSTKSVGDQLWLKVIGPASCGKSTLCEALSTCTEYTVAKSTIRGFHSGFTGPGQEDNSLIPVIKDKTLITKDGDTLLQSPNLGQILSEARDLYDSTSRTHYRNAVSRDYEGIRMTWLLCGTSSLRQIDASELGERFLDCVIMEGIDDDMEDEITWRVANRAARNVSIESDGKMETRYEPELANAMQLTGGYVKWLRENAFEGLAKLEIQEEALRQCARLGKFVAFMRARPSQRQEETAEREFAARLVSQLTRLAMCLAFVLNKPSVDTLVMERVKRVAMDTSRGRTLAIVEYLYGKGGDGSLLSPLANSVNETEDNTRTLLRFLRKIGVTEFFEPPAIKGVRQRGRWRLTERLSKLYQLVK
jgi:hypothetical protein